MPTKISVFYSRFKQDYHNNIEAFFCKLVGSAGAVSNVLELVYTRTFIITKPGNTTKVH